jgi:Arc/MetJ-type ribon-helix-helix transcriptional regulator
MPIVSFNISENLKKFLKRMVTRDEYKNNSLVIRDALVRLMAEKDGARSEIDVDALAELNQHLPKVAASVTITIDKTNVKLDRKINRLEMEYHDVILQKTIYHYRNSRTVTYLIENVMELVQGFITDLNSFEELKSFRYYIHEPDNE